MEMRKKRVPDGVIARACRIFDPRQQQFVSVPTAVSVPPNSRYADGVRTWAAQEEAEFDPKVLANGAAALIGLSKQTGILIPDSSYIAVESMAEWRAMEEKEKQKLKNNQVYELEEPIATPEPATWVLLVLGFVIIAFRSRRRA